MAMPEPPVHDCTCNSSLSHTLHTIHSTEQCHNFENCIENSEESPSPAYLSSTADPS